MGEYYFIYFSCVHFLTRTERTAMSDGETPEIREA